LATEVGHAREFRSNRDNALLSLRQHEHDRHLVEHATGLRGTDLAIPLAVPETVSRRPRGEAAVDIELVAVRNADAG